MNDAWIGVDLDGTLATYDTWRGFHHIGEPILPIVNRVKKWIAEGITVKILTARASVDHPDMLPTIEDWCEKHIGTKLEVTNAKDFGLVVFLDDRCIQVEANTGVLLGAHEELN